MGYGRLSRFMEEQNYAMFRKFQSSALRDLLFLQAELVHLETEYESAARADRESGDVDERQRYDHEWWHLSNSGSNSGYGRQWTLALEIRTKLREYCTFVSKRMTSNTR